MRRMELIQIQLSTLLANPLNPRGEVVADNSLNELAVSIEAQGILQPLLITPANTIIAGHRRAEAARLVGLENVPVIVKDLSDAQQIAVMLVENLQRQELNVVQEGKAYLALQREGLSNDQICETVGTSLSTIQNRIAIAMLPEDLHDAFGSGTLPSGCIRALQYMTADDQAYWVKRAVSKRWSGSQLNAAISQKSRENRSVPPHPPLAWETRQWTLSDVIKDLQDAEARLDRYKDCRAVQMLIRQASGLLDDTLRSDVEKRSA